MYEDFVKKIIFVRFEVVHYESVYIYLLEIEIIQEMSTNNALKRFIEFQCCAISYGKINNRCKQYKRRQLKSIGKIRLKKFC